MSATEAQASVVCPSCGEESLPGELFCENCGAELSPGAAVPAPAASPTPTPGDQGIPPQKGGAESLDQREVVCGNCGGTEFADGYCSTCGAPAVKERDHWTEQPSPWVAAVCDRGIRHHRNEDGVAISAGSQPGSLAALVVCDGVSSSADSDVASLAAARAARDVLTTQRPDSPSNAGRISAWTELLRQAAAAANDEAVRAAAAPSGRTSNAGRSDGPPSCTFVAAVVDGPLVVAGWVGDSRAYWVPDDGPAEQLSVDDSWASEQMQLGMSRAEAESGPHAHAITRWLGIDSQDFVPRTAALTATGPGWLLLCSDGLWNYCSEPAVLGALVHETQATTKADPLRLSSSLVDWANTQGGHDNITVAVARLDPATPVERDREGS